MISEQAPQISRSFDAKRAARAGVRGVASAHVKVIRANGDVEYRRSVSIPVPWWSVRLWVVWIRKHLEYNKIERNHV